MRKAILGLAPLLLAMGTAAIGQTASWRVSEVSGDVRVVEGGRARAATRGMLLSSGSTIATAARARAVIVRGQDYVQISPSSRLQVPATPQGRGGVIQMLTDWGTALFRIEHRAVPHFGVQTPYLAAVVKGTVFTVTVGEAGASVQVTEGAVEVATLDSGAVELIRPGMIGSVSAADLQQLNVEGETSRSIRSNGTPVTGAVTVPAPQVASYEGPPSQVIEITAPVAEDVVSLSEATDGLIDGRIGIELALADVTDEERLLMPPTDTGTIGSPPPAGDGGSGAPPADEDGTDASPPGGGTGAPPNDGETSTPPPGDDTGMPPADDDDVGTPPADDGTSTPPSGDDAGTPPDDGNNGHGNDDDGVDDGNPGHSGPGGGDQSGPGDDTGTPSDETGTPPDDTGTPPDETGAPPDDTGTPPDDTGTPPDDTGTPPDDTGTPPDDTGTPPDDTGTPPDDDGGIEICLPGDLLCVGVGVGDGDDTPPGDDGDPPIGICLPGDLLCIGIGGPAGGDDDGGDGPGGGPLCLPLLCRND